MRLNAQTVVIAEKVLLVPYGKHHVEKYHSWMENEEIRELTASLPLSIDEEYQMQQTWLNDPDKCTFIILSRAKFEQTHDEIQSMIGDVNLFLNDPDDSQCGEIEIMIAESVARQKGFGIETLCTFFRYVIDTLNLKRLVAKIGLKNTPSIELFSKKLQFETVQISEVFQEVTMKREVNDALIDFLKSKTPSYRLDNYENFSTSHQRQ